VTSDYRSASPPSPPALSGHPRRCATVLGTAAPSPALWEPGTTRHRHARCCASFGLPSAAPSNQRTNGDQTGNSHAATLEAAPGRVQDSPRRPTGARFVRMTINSTALCPMPLYLALRTVRRDCKPPPLAYKMRRRSPGRGGRRIAARLLSAFTTILALRLNQTSGTWRLLLLSRLACSSPCKYYGATQYKPRAHPCWTYGPRPEPG
jgi:hypothetical protein